MNKRQFWGALKEIQQQVDEWPDQFYQHCKDDMVFCKYLPKKDNWSELERYKIKITIEKDEETYSVNESTQSAKEG